MSLILEALRKLERERQAPDRGFVVLGPATWAGEGRSRWMIAGALIAAVAIGAAGAALLLGGRAAAPPVSPVVTAEPEAVAGNTAPTPIAPPTAIPEGPPIVINPAEMRLPLDQPGTGSTAGGSTAGGSTAGGSTAGGSTAGGSTAGGSTAGGSTAGGSTTGGSTAGAPDGRNGTAPPVVATTTDPPPATTATAKPAAGNASSERATPRPAGATHQLHAISVQDGAPVAIVDGRLVRVGDVLADGATVVAIGAASIEIETNGTRQVIGF